MIHHGQLGTKCAQLGKFVLAGGEACGIRIVAFLTGGKIITLFKRPTDAHVEPRKTEAIAARPVRTDTQPR